MSKNPDFYTEEIVSVAYTALKLLVYLYKAYICDYICYSFRI